MELVSPGVPPVPVKFWFGLNVFWPLCIYCLSVEPHHPGFRAWSDAQATSPAGDAACASRYARWLEEEVFRFTFGGAAKIGFHLNYECAEASGHWIVSIWLTVATDHDFW